MDTIDVWPDDPLRHLYIPHKETNPIAWMQNHNMAYALIVIWPLKRWSSPVGMWHVKIKKAAL